MKTRVKLFIQEIKGEKIGEKNGRWYSMQRLNVADEDCNKYQYYNAVSWNRMYSFKQGRWYDCVVEFRPYIGKSNFPTITMNISAVHDEATNVWVTRPDEFERPVEYQDGYEPPAGPEISKSNTYLTPEQLKMREEESISKAIVSDDLPF